MSMCRLFVDRVELKTAGADAVARGLIGIVGLRLNHGLRLEGLALRRTREGRHTLSFPARRDSRGEQVFFVRPIDDETREAIEHQVFTALGLM